MSGSLSKRIEVSANVAIILVAIVAAAVLVKRNFLGAKAPPAPATVTTQSPPPGSGRPIPGSKVSLPDVDWAASKQTLLIALARGCHFCTESAPFYQKLLRETSEQKGTRLIAVFPRESAAEAKGYLDEIGLPISEVRQAPLESIGARGTPTLVLVDGNGQVKESWLGRLQENTQMEVLSRLKCDTCDRP